MGFGRGQRRRDQASRVGSDLVRFEAGTSFVGSYELRRFAGAGGRVFGSSSFFSSTVSDYAWCSCVLLPAWHTGDAALP
ncbi:unnamed protein product [Ectocarpus sp. 12 AP-2014]